MSIRVRMHLVLLCLGVAGCQVTTPVETISEAVLSSPVVGANSHKAPALHIETVRTTDGVELPMYCYARKDAATYHAAVLLCHGLGYCSNIWDMDERSSIARHLAAREFIVFAPDMRGAGMSHAVGDFSIDDWALRDLPVLIASSRKASRGRPLFVLGHGFGGAALLWCLISEDVCQEVSGIITVGTAVTMPRPPDILLRDEESLRLCLRRPTRRFPSLLQRQSMQPTDGWGAIFFNPENVTTSHLELLCKTCSVGVPPTATSQVLRFVKEGRLTSADGSFDYSTALEGIGLPAFFIAGKADNLSLPESVRFMYRRAASADKTFRLFCLANGDGADFGNADLVCGKAAKSVVFGEIEKWMMKRTKPADHAK